MAVVYPPQLFDNEIDNILADIKSNANALLLMFQDEFSPKKKHNMKEKKPTTTEALNHDVHPEHKILRDAMAAWSEAAPENEHRSVIVIQVSEENGELSASSHVNGNSHHLVHAVGACMSACTPDNPVGSILRAAAIKSLTDLGMIAPHQPEGADAPEQPHPETPALETHNN